MAQANAESLNEIRLTVDPSELTAALAVPQKYEFKKARVQVNGDAIQDAAVSIRGQNCLKSPRRCLGVKVEKKVMLFGESQLSSKNLNLVSMWEDQGYVSSKIGYGMFKALGHFNLRNEYAEVFVNGVSNGLYLVTEKPKKAVEQMAPDAFVARRGIEYRFEIAEGVKPGARFTDAEYIAAFKKLYADLKTLQGQALKTRIEETLNLESYMNWLAVNSLLKNGDYSDEVFFYADSRAARIRFSVFPWDMDDLFRPPHAGALNRKYQTQLETALLYSYENPLDIKIGTDPVLYAEFKRVMRELLLNSASDRLIEGVIDTVKRNISPYLDRPSVLEGSRIDRGRAYTKASILRLAEKRKADIKERREILKARL